MSNNEDTNATALMGTLVGFLVVGIIGIYIGDQMLDAASLNESDSLYSSQTTILDTFNLGITLCKVIVIVSIAAIIFIMLGKTGLIPNFAKGGRGGDY